MTITSGSLPSGLTFSGGVLSGTPSAAGSVSFKIVASDSSASPGPYSSSSQSYSLTINASPVTITLSPSSETLTAGTVGTAYSQTFTASGGISPHTYAMTITSGSLPSGLTFSGGVLSGTPSASGSVSFTIIASDSSASPGPYSSSSQSYSLTVNASSADSTSTAVSVPSMFISGQTASITATVTDTTHSGTTPTGGTVAFTDAVNGGSAVALSSVPVTLSSGQATLSVVLSGAGTHVITATYAGVGGTFAGSSGTSTVTVGPSSNVGTATSSYPVTLAFTAEGTLNSIDVLTQGAPNLDFRDAVSGDTCVVGSIYSAGDTCIVDVIFTPKYPGPRYGAVLLEDGAGNVLATAFIYGTGTGPMVNFLPGIVSTLAATYSFNSPYGVAVDGSGNVFVADYGNNAVEEILAAGGYTTVNALAAGNFSGPTGVAVDGSGNVFVTDLSSNPVKEILGAGGYTTVNTLAATYSFNSPYGVAVDGSGNVFVADYGNSAVEEILAAGGYTTVNTLAAGNFIGPSGLAVDGSGNVFVADAGNYADNNSNSAVYEIVAAGGYTTVNTLAVANGNFNGPSGVAVDGNENVFVADYGNNAVKEILAAGGYTTVNTLGSGFSLPNGVAVDGRGNLFVADSGNNAVKEIDFADPPSLAFLTPTPAGSTDSTDGSLVVTVENIGNAALTFSASGLTAPTDFTLVAGSGTPADCAANGSVAAGASCNLSIEFKPTQVGSPLNELFVLTDNALNVTSATQSISLSGAATAPTITLSPSSETLTAGTVGTAYSQTFTASGGISPHTYAMTITSGSLPSGLTFSGGVLSGTPSASGSVSFTIIASDSSASPGPYSSSSQSYSLTVNASSADSTSTAVSVPSMFISGQTASITATVTDTTHSGTTPTGGTVAFTDAVNGGSAVALSSVPVTLSSGQATLSVVLSGAGTHVITATYAGVGGTFAGSSGTSTVTVGPSSNVGTATSSYPVTLAFTAEGTLNSIDVLTQGAPNLDFRDAVSGDTCVVGSIYSAGDTCIVDVIFTPKYPGPRYGAVLLEDGAGNVLATAFIYGTGTGPMVNFLPGIVSTLAATYSFNSPYGVAVDGSGNVFVADYGNNAVEEILAAGGYTTVNALAAGNFSGPTGVAVDGSGNVFVTDLSSNPVKEILGAGGYTTVNTLAATYSFNSPYGVAVDGSGNVFVADYGNSAVEEILAAGGYTTVNTLAAGNFIGPSGLAVDGSGNVFVADAGNYADNNSNSAVYEIVAAGGYTTVNTLAVANGNFNGPSGVAVDGNENVFVADYGNNAVKEILAAGGYTTVNTLGSGFSLPNGVAVDGRGNLFVADSGNNAVKEIDFADPPSLAFLTPTPAGSTDSTDGSLVVTVENIGNAALTFSASGLTAPTDFTLVAGSGTPADCAANGSVAAGASCNLSIEFKPTQAGSPLNESFVLTDNALNVTGATQLIALQGTGIQSSQSSQSISFPNPGPLTYGVGPVTLDAAASSALPVSYTVTSGPATVSGSTLTITGAGSVSVQATQAGNTNYTAAAPVGVTFAVGQASLTITANSASKIYGAANPGFTPSYSGFANGDTAAVLTGSPSLTTTATAASVAGTYPITAAAGTLSAANYSFSYVAGTLTVTAAPTTLAWAPPAAITYGTALNSTQLNATATVAGTFAYSPVAGTVLSPGLHTLSVTFTPTDTRDYTTQTTTVPLMVKAATLTVTANNASRAVGATNPTLTASYSGFVNGDTAAVLGGSPVLSTTATTSSPAGTYPITVAAGTLTAANYSIHYVNGTLSVVQAPSVSVSASATVAGSASNGYTLTISIKNTGTGTVSNVVLTAATLGTASGSPLPQTLASIAQGATGIFTVNFPGSTGANGAGVAEKYSGTIAGGSFSGSMRSVILP
jgi:streptogramin lyase